MRDRKLYDLLRRLSADERALFAEFLRSPLHAHRPKLAEMVELMERLLFAAPEHPCSSEDFYAAFYPGKPYDSNNLNRLISVITSEFKEFLALRFFQRDRTARTACATREMSRRRWDDILPKEIALTRKVLQEELPDDEHNYYQLYCLEYENARHYIESSTQKGAPIYQPLLDTVDHHFLLLKQKMMACVYLYDRKFNTKHIIRWAEVCESIEAKELDERTSTSKLFGLAQKMFQSQHTRESHADYVEKIEASLPTFDRDNTPTFSGKINKVDSESLIEFGQMMTNFVANGDKEFHKREYLRSVKFGISKKILLVEGFLQSLAYINYIRMASSSDDTQEAWEFLTINAPLLKEEDQKFVPEIASGGLFITEGNPKAALKILIKLKSSLGPNTYFWNQLETRMLLCLSWFQLGDIESLTHEANAMRTFLDRVKPISRQYTLTYRRFLKAVFSIEKAERKAPDKRLDKYRKVLGHILSNPKFSGSHILAREIQNRLNEKS